MMKKSIVKEKVGQSGFYLKKLPIFATKRNVFMSTTVLNDAQLDLLNLLHWVNSPEVLADLKQVISDYFAQKGKEEIDAMWARGELTQKKVDGFMNLHERTPYNR